MNRKPAAEPGQRLWGLEELSESILRGDAYFLAGDEELLRRLPRGRWIGGTIPYFMAESGGTMVRDRIFATPVPACTTGVDIRAYDARSLFDVYQDAPSNGFTFIVMPAQSPTHLSFAINAPRYDGFASRPLIGWVSGIALADAGRRSPKVFDGRDGRALADGAVAMHVGLPSDKTADVGLINIFEPGDGDVLTFSSDSFNVKEVSVNGRPRRFADYLREKNLDMRLPLVADCAGAMLNVSFQEVDEATGEARFYAPLFKGVRYRQARPIGDYIEAFTARVPESADASIIFSCNCILNYMHAGLEGRRTAGIVGPFTFGEIAYQLLNQTLAYLTISDRSLADRLRADAPLRRRNRFLETLMDAIPSPVFFKDVHGRYLGCNKAYVEFFGRSKDQIIGKTVSDLPPENLASDDLRPDDDLLRRAGAVLEHQLEVTDAAGRRRDIVVRTTTFLDEDGRAAGLIGILSDVTERQLSERRLAGAYAKLESAQNQLLQSQKMAAVGRLAGGIAHEINNPLGVILGFAQSLNQEIADGHDLAVPLRSIEREALRCRNLVKDLLVFSRSSGSNAFVETDMSGAVNESLSLLEPRAKVERVELRVELAPGLPPVLGSANQLQQVVLNLAGNALDAMPRGGRLEILTRVSARRPGYVELAVRDTGGGIPEEIRPRIFEPFFTTKEVGAGTGLGLALVYEIVDRHGGCVELATEEGAGTTFTVSLPVHAR